MNKRNFNESVDLNKVMEMGSQHQNFRVAWIKISYFQDSKTNLARIKESNKHPTDYDDTNEKKKYAFVDTSNNLIKN